MQTTTNGDQALLANKACVLFDLDGTLTDSRPGITACVQFALARLGVESPADLSWCLGPPLHDSFAKLLASQGVAVTSERVAEAVALYRERFVAQGMFENEVYDGIPRVLEELGRRGHRLFVATSKPAVYARQIAAHFGLAYHFEKIYGSELDGRLSNKAELIASVLETEKLAAGSVAMIGDRAHDMIGARACSVFAIGVLWGYGSRDELLSAGAESLVQAPAELLS